jgi:hypothetical protein
MAENRSAIESLGFAQEGFAITAGEGPRKGQKWALKVSNILELIDPIVTVNEGRSGGRFSATNRKQTLGQNHRIPRARNCAAIMLSQV